MTDNRILEIDYTTPPTLNDVATFDGDKWVPQASGGGGGGITIEQAQDAIGTILLDSSTIDFTYNDPAPSITAIVIDGSITYAKIQDVSAASRVLGRGDSGSGDTQELTLGNGLEMSGTTVRSTTNSTTQTLAFGASFTDKAETVVTGQAWVTANSEIVPQVLTPTGTDPDELRLLDFVPIISSLVPGTGFTITLYSEPEAKGDYSVMCIGVA